VDVEALSDLYLSNPLLFYDTVADADDLIEFSRKRPDSDMSAFNMRGNKEVAVVVPTPSRSGAHAKNVANMFKDFNLFFVESSGKYFNYSKSLNFGVKIALETDPKWVIISNDDVYEVDPIPALRQFLQQADPERLDYILVDPAPDYYHSYSFFIVRQRTLVKQILYPLRKRDIRAKVLTELSDKFGIKYYKMAVNPSKKGGSLEYDVIFKKIVSQAFYNIGDFGIFSSNFLNNYMKRTQLFDADFINGYEDIDLSLRLQLGGYKLEKASFKIGSYVGMSLGGCEARILKAVFNMAVFNKKWGRVFDGLARRDHSPETQGDASLPKL